MVNEASWEGGGGKGERREEQRKRGREEQRNRGREEERKRGREGGREKKCVCRMDGSARFERYAQAERASE